MLERLVELVEVREDDAGVVHKIGTCVNEMEQVLKTCVDSIEDILDCASPGMIRSPSDCDVSMRVDGLSHQWTEMRG